MPPGTVTDKARLDLSRYELTLNGQRMKLARQPMDLLVFFAERCGKLVTREQIVERLWGRSVFVDAETGINRAVRKIRAALRDDPEAPRFLETVIGKGYRLIGDIEVVQALPEPGRAPRPDTRPEILPRPLARAALYALGLIVLGLGPTLWLARAPLRRAFSIGNGSSIRSVAVLPLENLSGDPKQDYFADGMTDELTTDLARISSLKVISRTSAMNYRGVRAPLPQIARELGVDAVIEGSVARTRGRVLITAQLIDAREDRHLWAESYDRDLDDVLAVQHVLALEIAREVRIHLTPGEDSELRQHRTVASEAYDAYLHGRYLQTQQSPDALQEGLLAFERSVALDATFAPAYAGLADDYSLLANYGVAAPREAFPQAEKAAKKALELDPSSAEAHTALAYPENHYTWEWTAAEREYKTALALSPSYATAHFRYAELLSSVGRHDEAIAEVRRARELDPLSLVVLSNLGRFLYHARRYDEAIPVLKEVLRIDPRRVYAQLHLAMCYEEKGTPESDAAWEKTRSALGGQDGPGYAHFLARSGRVGRAREIARRLEKDARDSDWFFLAGVHAALGDKDEAFACLEKAYATRDFFLAFVKVHPYMDPLQRDPRYAELLRRIGLS